MNQEVIATATDCLKGSATVQEAARKFAIALIKRRSLRAAVALDVLEYVAAQPAKEPDVA
jgi:hypothetical protein